MKTKDKDISFSQEQVDQSRRRLTQMVWTTPVITSIILPAHAQTSSTTTVAPTTTSTTTTVAPTTTATPCLENELSCSIRVETFFNPFRDVMFVDITATSQCNADFSGALVRLFGTGGDFANRNTPVEFTAPLDASGNVTILAVTTFEGNINGDFTVNFVDQATYGPAAGACMGGFTD